jgi:hypothetical protein
MKDFAKAFLTCGLLSAIMLGAIFAHADGNWLTISRGSLCVTEGTIEKAVGDHLSVDVPKMRAS